MEPVRSQTNREPALVDPVGAARSSGPAGTKLDAAEHQGAVDGASYRGCCEAASAALVTQHYADLFGWLAWLTRDRELAADLTQEAYTEFWVSVRRRPVRDARLWLFSIARNRWRKASRRRRIDRITPVADLESVAASVGNSVLGEPELTELVAALLARLPAVVREAVVLRYWYDFDYRGIAVVQSVPAALARWRVHRGRGLLRGWLHEKGLVAEDLIHDDR